MSAAPSEAKLSVLSLLVTLAFLQKQELLFLCLINNFAFGQHNIGHDACSLIRRGPKPQTSVVSMLVQ